MTKKFFKNLAMSRFSRYVWQFFNVVHEMVNEKKKRIKRNCKTAAIITAVKIRINNLQNRPVKKTKIVLGMEVIILKNIHIRVSMIIKEMVRTQTH